MDQQWRRDKLNKRVGELCKNVTRKKIVEIAQQNSWEILPAGKEPLKACRKGYRSVPIPGHNNGAVIPYSTAFSVIKSLLEPSLSEVVDKERINAYQHNLDFQKVRADKAEAQLEVADFTIIRLNADVEAGLELAAKTEIRNKELSKELHRHNCWIKGLQQKIANLIQQRARQEAEMLMIADEVEHQERLIKSSAEMLTEFSLRLKPTLRQELKQIIRYLGEEST